MQFYNTMYTDEILKYQISDIDINKQIFLFKNKFTYKTSF